MKRKMLFITIPFIISLFVIFNSIFGYIVLSAASFFILFISLYMKKINIKQLLLISLSWLLALGVFLPYNSYRNVFVNKYTHGTYEFVGEITNVKEYASDKTTYTLKGRFANGDKAVLSLYTDDLGGRYGDKIKLDSSFSTYENNYLFSSQNYNFGKGIFIQPDNIEKTELIETSSPMINFFRTVKNYRKHISSKIMQKFGSDTGGIINAMMFGDKTELDDNSKTAFYRTGIGHMMAVSGLHLVFVISIFCFIIKKLKIPRIFNFFVSIAIIFLFSICVDSPVSVVRAGIMVYISKQGELIFRKNDPLNSLALCVFVMLIFQPYLIMNPSFLLSVSGTYGVSVAGPYFTEVSSDNKNIPKILKSLITMICVSVCVFPVSAIFFDETSLISPISNIFLVPLCMFVLFLSFVIFFTNANNVVISLLHPIIKYSVWVIRKITEFMSDLGFSHISLGNKKIGFALLCMSAVIIFLYLFFKNKKLVAFAAALSIFITSILNFSNTFYESKYLKVAVLGDNKNCISVISYKGNTFVYDLTGKSSATDYTRKYLQQKGIDKVSALFLCKNQAFSASSYNDVKIASHINTVVIPDEYEKWLCGSSISGVSPSYVNGYPEIEYDDARITFRNKKLCIYLKDYSICISENTDIKEQNYNALFVYGNRINDFSQINTISFAPKDNANLNASKIKYYYKHNISGALSAKDPKETFDKMDSIFSPEYPCEHNIEFLIDQNGKITERSLV